MSYTTRAPRTRTVTSKDTEGGEVRCTGHNRTARRSRAGPMTKNAGRYFYSCPLGLDDSKRCKYFKWEDELSQVNSPAKPTASTNGGGMGGGQTLGRSPARLVSAVASGHVAAEGQSTPKRPRISNWFSPSRPAPPANAAASTSTAKAKAPASGSTSIISASSSADTVEIFSDGSQDDQEIDWGSIDTDALEKDAEERTPHRDREAERAGLAQTRSLPAKHTPAGRLAERLAAAASVAGKRKRDNDEGGESHGATSASAGPAAPAGAHGHGRATSVDSEGSNVESVQTPTRPRSTNPFLETTPKAPIPAPATPSTTHTTVSAVVPPTPGDGSNLTAHPALGPLQLSIEGLGEHLARQDRLVRAAEAMKKSMRVTISHLQVRVKELEDEVSALKSAKGK